ncbi:MAG: prenyltransferase [Pyrinomonadaceae bacterium]|nr:prenyltransferase [Pyrinomonadaceae bacterium]
MSEIRQIIKISRPRFWIYIFGPYIVGLAAAASNQSDLYSWKVAIFALFFLIPANLLIYGVNDIFDYETDKINRKKIEYETLVTPEAAKRLSVIIFLFNIPFIAASYLLVSGASVPLLCFYFFSIFYSTPPIRAKTKPLIDSLFNVLYIFPGIFAFKMVSGSYPSPLIFAAAGLWTMAMHAYSAIPDIEADKAAGISTIATKLGSTATHIFCALLYVGSAILAYKYLGHISILFALVYSTMLLISLRFSRFNAVFKIYRYFPYINAVIGFILFWYIAFEKFL